MPSPDSSPLLDHLQTLYPAACLLSAPDAADTLLLRVYERASELSPAERPDDVQGWLLGLLLEESASSPSPLQIQSTSNAPEQQPDRLQEEVAREVTQEALPTALAACTRQERFLLAMEAFNEATENLDASLASALGVTPDQAQTLREQAHTALRDNLQAVLSPPEQSLIEEALPKAFIREALPELFANRLSHAPSSLRSQIRETLQSRREERGTAPPSQNTEPAQEESPSVLSRLPSSGTSQILLGLLILGLVAAGLFGVSFFGPSTSSSSGSNTSLIAFSAQHVGAVSPTLSTQSPQEAKTYVASNWNRQVAIPTIEEAQLQGVGHLPVGGSVVIPVLLYADTEDSTRSAIFAYNYALLDQLNSMISLSESLRDKLGRSTHLIALEDSAHGGLLWRRRDDIFVAVHPTSPVESLRTRIHPGG